MISPEVLQERNIQLAHACNKEIDRADRAESALIVALSLLAEARISVNYHAGMQNSDSDTGKADCEVFDARLERIDQILSHPVADDAPGLLNELRHENARRAELLTQLLAHAEHLEDQLNPTGAEIPEPKLYELVREWTHIEGHADI